MKIIVAVLCPIFLPLLLLLSFSLCPLWLTRLDVVIFNEAIVILNQPTGSCSNHFRHTVGKGHLILAILADPVSLLEQGVSVAHQEAMEEAKLYHHHNEEGDGEDCAQSCSQIGPFQ